MNPDDDKCFEDFLAHLFRENIEPKMVRFLSDSFSLQPQSSNYGGYGTSPPQTSVSPSDPTDFDVRREMANWRSPRAAMRAMSVINHINYHCPTDNDIYTIFTRQGLVNTLYDVIDTVLIAKVAADRNGYLDVIDDNFLPIFNGIKIEHLPTHDREVLRSMGSKDPEADLCAMLQSLLSRKELLHSEAQTMRSTQMLENTVEKLRESKTQIEEREERITYTPTSGLPNKKRWGLFGLILKGASLVVPDVLSAASPFLSSAAIDPVQSVKAGFESISSIQLGVQTVRDGYIKLK